jgi:hypothetical protein
VFLGTGQHASQAEAGMFYLGALGECGFSCHNTEFIIPKPHVRALNWLGRPYSGRGSIDTTFASEDSPTVSMMF